MARITHDDWRELWEERQSFFHRPQILASTAAVLFHMDSFREEPPDPIFPYVTTSYRQFQWFESLDELASYILHVCFHTDLCIWDLGDPGINVLDAPSAIAVRSDIAEPAKARAQELLPLMQRVAAAVGGPREQLLGALADLPALMGSQRIFQNVEDAVRWSMESLPDALEQGEERGDARPEDARERARWVEDARATHDPDAMARTRHRLMALCD